MNVTPILCDESTSPVAQTLCAFVGTYTVRQGSNIGGSPEKLEIGDVLKVGTDPAEAPPPGVDEHGNFRVGVATYAADGTRTFPDDAHLPAWFELRDGHLRYHEILDQKILRRIQLSLLEVQGVDGPYKAVYGVSVWDDPQQVGAWGADDNP